MIDEGFNGRQRVLININPSYEIYPSGTIEASLIGCPLVRATSLL
jgi:hypothetical protein